MCSNFVSISWPNSLQNVDNGLHKPEMHKYEALVESDASSLVFMLLVLSS